MTIFLGQNSCFISCSADGTVRFFDLRRKYQKMRVENSIKEGTLSFDELLPQVKSKQKKNEKIMKQITIRLNFLLN